MIFYDWEPNELPADACYYYNILLINIYLSPDYAPEILGDKIIDAWYLDNILSERPYVVHIFIDPELDEDYDYLIEQVPHCVIETHPTLGPSWYHMVDFDTEDFWRIEPEYDEEEEY